MKDFTVDASTRIERALTQTIIRAGATCVPPALLQAVPARAHLLLVGDTDQLPSVGAGNVLRGFISYGTILAGYSASMVALLSTAHPDRVLLLGVDRFLTVFTGVAVAMLVGLLFTPKAAEEEGGGRRKEEQRRKQQRHLLFSLLLCPAQPRLHERDLQFHRDGGANGGTVWLIVNVN